MNLPCNGIHHARQGIDISGQKFFKAAGLQYQPHYRVGGAVLLQNLLGRGESPGLGALRLGIELHLSEKDFTHLHGGTDIEPFPGKFVGTLLDVAHLQGKLL